MSFNTKTNLYEGYIYKIYNDVNNKLYIGQTIADLSIRFSQHKSAARHLSDDTYSVLYNAMNKEGIDKFHICCLKKYEQLSLQKLKNILNSEEQRYILLYSSLVPNGYNMTKGGDSGDERRGTAVDAYYINGSLYKTYNSIADAIREIRKEGKYNSHCNRIGACCEGKAQSCWGYVWRYKGDPFDKFPVTITQEWADSFRHASPVDQYTIDGHMIKRYSTINGAARAMKSKYPHAMSAAIRKSCIGVFNQAYGYVWRYKGDSFDKYEWKADKRYHPVNVYTIDNSYIATFNTTVQAMEALNIKKSGHTHIVQCCKKKRNQAYGYHWYYAEDIAQPDVSKIKLKDVA